MELKIKWCTATSTGWNGHRLLCGRLEHDHTRKHYSPLGGQQWGVGQPWNHQ